MAEREFTAADKDRLTAGLKEGKRKIILNEEGLPLVTKPSEQDGFKCNVYFERCKEFNICNFNNGMNIFGVQNGELFEATKKETAFIGTFVEDAQNFIIEGDGEPIKVKFLMSERMKELGVNGVEIKIHKILCATRPDKLMCKGWARQDDGKRHPSKFWEDREDEYKVTQIDWINIIDEEIDANATINSNNVAEATPAESTAENAPKNDKNK